jgi:hypothetical protein
MGLTEEAAELVEIARKSPAVRKVEKAQKTTMVWPANEALDPVRIPGTPSDWRGLENCKAALRRIGVEIPHRGGPVSQRRAEMSEAEKKADTKARKQKRAQKRRKP